MEGAQRPQCVVCFAVALLGLALVMLLFVLLLIPRHLHWEGAEPPWVLQLEHPSLFWGGELLSL